MIIVQSISRFCSIWAAYLLLSNQALSFLEVIHSSQHSAGTGKVAKCSSYMVSLKRSMESHTVSKMQRLTFWIEIRYCKPYIEYSKSISDFQKCRNSLNVLSHREKFA